MKFKIKNLKLPLEIQRISGTQSSESFQDSRGKIQDLKSLNNLKSSIWNLQSPIPIDFSEIKPWGQVPNPQSPMGLTLIEIMVVIAILAIMTTGILTVFQGSLLSQRRGTSKALVYSEARATLDMMSREIEKAMVDERKGIGWQQNDQIDPKIKGGSTAYEFFFVAPLNPDNDSDEDYMGDLCEVGYWLRGSDNTLMRHYTSKSTDFDFDTGNSNQLIGSVSNLQFEYFDGTGWRTSSGGKAIDWFPKAVKIILVLEYEMEKDEIRQDTFITVVNIPGSGQ